MVIKVLKVVANGKGRVRGSVKAEGETQWRNEGGNKGYSSEK